MNLLRSQMTISHGSIKFIYSTRWNILNCIVKVFYFSFQSQDSNEGVHLWPKAEEMQTSSGPSTPDPLDPRSNCEMDSNDPSGWPGSPKPCTPLTLCWAPDLTSPGHTDLWPTLDWCYQHPSDSTLGDFPFISVTSHICPVEWLCSVLMKLIETQIKKILEGISYFYWTKFWSQALFSHKKWTIPIQICTIAFVCPKYLARVHQVLVSCLTVKASAWACRHRSQLKWPQKVLLNPHRPLYARSLVTLPFPIPASHLDCGLSKSSGRATRACLAWSVVAIRLLLMTLPPWPQMTLDPSDWARGPELASAYSHCAKIWYGHKVVTPLSHYCHSDHLQ